jgi:hypothetical protein
MTWCHGIYQQGSQLLDKLLAALKQLSPTRTVVFVMFVFVSWLVSILFLIIWPKRGTPKNIYLVSYLMFAVVLCAIVGCPAWSNSHLGDFSYSRNQRNTIITIGVTVFAVPQLYCHLWYPDRVLSKIVFNEDTVVGDPSLLDSISSGKLIGLCPRTRRTILRLPYFKVPTGHPKPIWTLLRPQSVFLGCTTRTRQIVTLSSPGRYHVAAMAPGGKASWTTCGRTPPTGRYASPPPWLCDASPLLLRCLPRPSSTVSFHRTPAFKDTVLVIS